MSAFGSATDAPGTASAQDGRVLIVSDAPERIPQHWNRATLPLASGSTGSVFDTHSLYKCEIPLTQGVARQFRVFLWHESHLSDDAFLMIIAHLTSGTAAVSNAEQQVVQSVVAGGRCIAVATLHGTLDGFAPINGTLNTGGLQVWRTALPAGAFRGALVQFTLTASHDCTLRLRTAVGPSTVAPGSWSDPVAWDAQQTPLPGGGFQEVVHTRGWWPYSTVRMNAGGLDVKAVPDPASRREIQVLAGSDSPERIMFAKQAADTYGTADGNKGAWGATLEYEFTFVNTGSSADTGGVALIARNNGGNTFGAAQVQGRGYTNRGFEPIGQSGFRSANITSSGTADSPIRVSAGGSESVLVRVVVGGGSTLPVNLRAQATHSYQGGGSGGDD